MHVDKVDLEISCSGRHKLCAAVPRQCGHPLCSFAVQFSAVEHIFDVTGSQIQENLVERWKRFSRVASLRSLILRLTTGPFHKLSGTWAALGTTPPTILLTTAVKSQVEVMRRFCLRRPKATCP